MFSTWRWTEKSLGIAVEVLSRSDSVKKAAAELTRVLGFTVSRATLKEAFRKHGVGRPMMYLKANLVKEGSDKLLVGPDEAEVSGDQDDDGSSVDEPYCPMPVPPALIDEPEPGEFPTAEPMRLNFNFAEMYPPVQALKGEARWIVFSDLHIPFEDAVAFERMLESSAVQRARGVVFGGDCVDCEQFGSHGRTHDRPLSLDYHRFAEIVATVCERLPNMEQFVIIAGNHDNWPIRYRQKMIRSDAYFLVRDAAGNDLMEFIGRIKLDVPDDRLRYRFGVRNWWTEIGDMIVAHPKKYLKPQVGGREGRTVFDVFKWFNKRRHDIRCMVIGHTHRLHFERTIPSVFGRQVLLAESGCMQAEAQYTEDGRVSHDPFHVGWFEAVQIDGVTQFDRCRIEHLWTV